MYEIFYDKEFDPREGPRHQAALVPPTLSITQLLVPNLREIFLGISFSAEDFICYLCKSFYELNRMNHHHRFPFISNFMTNNYGGMYEGFYLGKLAKMGNRLE